MIKSFFMRYGEYRQETHGSPGEAIGFLIEGRDCCFFFPIGIYSENILYIYSLAKDLVLDVKVYAGIGDVETVDIDLDDWLENLCGGLLAN